MVGTLQKVKSLFTVDEHKQAKHMLVLVCFMGMVETISILFVVPTLTILVDPGASSHRAVVFVNGFINGSSYSIGVMMGFACALLVFISSVVRSLVIFQLNRFIELKRHSLGTRLLKIYLTQSYEFFVQRHSSSITKNVLSEVDLFVGQFLRPVILLVSQTIVAFLILLMLFIVEPAVSLVALFVLCIAYLFIFLLLRGPLLRAGQERVKANEERFFVASECLSGIREIKLKGLEGQYLRAYRAPSKNFSDKQALAASLTQIPRFSVEALLVGGTILAASLLSVNSSMGGDDWARVIPLVGMFGFAAIKLVPACQHIYQGFAQVRSGLSVLNVLVNDFSLANGLSETKPLGTAVTAENSVFAGPIRFENVFYSYPGEDVPALSEVCFKISPGEAIGVVGVSGAGKSTLVDILVGLLEPSIGKIMIGNRKLGIDLSYQDWRACVGYVSQDVFLLDGTISENISFGLVGAEINIDLVMKCAKAACIHDYVYHELEDGYNSSVGERGVKLSGGQRQRIGVARALYTQPKLLVMDEATSALDIVTEAKVMNEVRKLFGDLSVVMIAHRVATLKDCNKVLRMESGRITWIGAYEDIV